MNESKRHTDIISDGWIAKVPPHLQPYVYLMRLDRPIGTWLLLLPGWWAIMLAGGGVSFLILFALGAIIMRGAGCIINDLWDRNLDKEVERTSTRPLASGAVSVPQAIKFLALLLFMGLMILLQFNWTTIGLGVLSLVFVVLYPLMKRWTWWPQAFLGLTFNFGALLGWTAVTGSVTLPALLLYAGGFFWTLGYDTIYALQDKDDDALIGIKSTARLFIEKWEVNPALPCGLFYGISFFMLVAVLFSVGSLSSGFVLVLAPALHLVWQVATLKPDDPKNALQRFKSNRDFGLIYFLVILFLY